MRKVVLSALLLVLCNQIQSQLPIQNTFAVSTGFDKAASIIANNGGYSLFGNAKIGNKYELYILQLDAGGNQTALHKFGLGSNQSATRAFAAVDNNGWVAGSATGLWRIGADGAIVWHKSNIVINQLEILPDNAGFLATGANVLYRIDNDGNLEWSKSYPGGISAMCMLPSGMSCYIVNSGTVRKIHTTNGAITWERNYTPPPYGDTTIAPLLTVKDIALTNGADFVVTGTLLKDDIFSFTTGGYLSGWASNGQQQWQLAADDAKQPYSIGWMPNSKNILVAGTLGDISSEFYIEKYDLQGNNIQTQKIQPGGIVVDPVVIRHNGYYAFCGGRLNAGNMNSFFYRSAGNWLTSPVGGTTGDDILTNKIQGDRINVAPTLSDGYFTVGFYAEKATSSVLQCIDIEGRIVKSQPVDVEPGNNQIQVSMPDASKGFYQLYLSGLALPAARIIIK